MTLFTMFMVDIPLQIARPLNGGAPTLRQLYAQLAPQHPRRPQQRLQRDVPARRIEQPVELRAACMHHRRHLVLGELLGLHRLQNLPGDNFLDGNRSELFQRAFFFEEAFKAGAVRRVCALCHRFTSRLCPRLVERVPDLLIRRELASVRLLHRNFDALDLLFRKFELRLALG